MTGKEKFWIFAKHLEGEKRLKDEARNLIGVRMKQGWNYR